MKTLLLASFLLLTTFATKPPSYVLICESKNAYAYHSKESCNGFNKCQAKRSKVTKEEAIAKDYRACRICYK